MKENKTIFQLVVAGIFGLLFVVGFAMFATYKSPKSKDIVEIGEVVIWGTMDHRIINELLGKIANKDQEFSHIKYFEKSMKTFNDDILEALATQESPDLILLSNSDFVKNRNKLVAIPYKNFSQRKFQDTFADAFEAYLTPDGILGIPFAIDPMVMYYNKTLFASNRIVLPPKKWDQLERVGGIYNNLNKLDSSSNILKSSIALGESNNVNHYKEILYTLFFQQDNPVIESDREGYFVSDKFNDKGSIIKFYTQFSDQTNKISYSWNKAKHSSEEEFISGDLGIYLGFVSELSNLRKKNPNLNFNVAEIPTFNNSKENKVYARTWVFAIPKMSNNKIGAQYTALEFASEDIQEALMNKIFLPPVRRDMLNEIPENSFLDIFFREAIYGQTILEPNKREIDKIFADYINNVNTNLRTPGEATNILRSELNDLLKRYR